jgi:hypothetical protein
VAICRSLAAARAAFAAAIAEKPAARFMMRSRTRVVKRYPEGDWSESVGHRLSAKAIPCPRSLILLQSQRLLV